VPLKGLVAKRRESRMSEPGLKHFAASYRANPAALGGVGPAMDQLLQQFHGAKLFGYGGPDGNLIIQYENGNEPRTVLRTPGTVAQDAYLAKNSWLWPLLHEKAKYAVLTSETRPLLSELSRHMAAPVMKAINEVDYAHVFTQDYHYTELAPMLRSRFRGKILIISHFCHTSWPSAASIPKEYRSQFRKVVRGLIRADFVGFHTRKWMENFLAHVEGLKDVRVDLSGDLPILHLKDGHYCQLIVQPLGIRSQRWQQLATGDLPHLDFAERDIVLAVERNDYTKRVASRFKAVQEYFRRYPEEIERTVFFQVAAPTRKDVPAFQGVWQECVEIENEILAEHSGRIKEDWTPLFWEKRDGGFKPEELAPLYRHAKVGTVSPDMDGLNLVAKEFVVCQNQEDPGVLCLSRGAGFWSEVGDTAIELCPDNPVQMAQAIHRALRELSLAERQVRNYRLRMSVLSNPLERWVDTFVTHATLKFLNLTKARNLT
jgi:trehalose 6-phosphate synthase